jgi:hypothetical protein
MMMIAGILQKNSVILLRTVSFTRFKQREIFHSEMEDILYVT